MWVPLHQSNASNRWISSCEANYNSAPVAHVTSTAQRTNPAEDYLQVQIPSSALEHRRQDCRKTGAHAQGRHFPPHYKLQSVSWQPFVEVAVMCQSVQMTEESHRPWSHGAQNLSEPQSLSCSKLWEGSKTQMTKFQRGSKKSIKICLYRKPTIVTPDHIHCCQNCDHSRKADQIYEIC